jgi:hypothetical protein
MALVHGLVTPSDLFAKLTRELSSLERALIDGSDTGVSDAIFNFSVTSYHLRDWVQAHEPRLESLLESLFTASPELQACRDIANSSKHLKIERYIPTTDEVFVSASPPLPEYGTRGRIKIRMNDGQKFEVQDWAAASEDTWRTFLVQNKLLK